VDNFLVENHIVFADKIACQKKKKLPKYIDIEDLKSAAYMGLVKAATKYDNEFGASFTTFAFYRISGEIDDYLRKFHRRAFMSLQQEDGQIDVPEKQKIKSVDFFEKFEKTLSQKMTYVLRSYFYEDKSLKEIGEDLGITESRVSQILTQTKSIIKDNFSGDDLWEELLAA
jgi:RNA polymerase sigma factor for flagellar operon FliA